MAMLLLTFAIIAYIWIVSTISTRFKYHLLLLMVFPCQIAYEASVIAVGQSIIIVT